MFRSHKFRISLIINSVFDGEMAFNFDSGQVCINFITKLTIFTVQYWYFRLNEKCLVVVFLLMYLKVRKENTHWKKMF